VSVGQALATDIQKFGSILAPPDDNDGDGDYFGGQGTSAAEGYRTVLNEWRVMAQELLILRTVLDEQLQATFVQVGCYRSVEVEVGVACRCCFSLDLTHQLILGALVIFSLSFY
jgi:hypothetical protein